MKVKSVAGLCVCLLAALGGNAQVGGLRELPITTNETTLIVSHFGIRSVDRGSRDVLVQRVKGADTILEVKAARMNFPETDLTVLTGDGVVHMFKVTYSQSPERLEYNIEEGQTDSVGRTQEQGRHALTEADYEQITDSILRSPVQFRRLQQKSYGTMASLVGMYVHEEVMFFRFRLRNSTHIPYDISQLNFYIRDNSQAKRTASQDLIQSPLFFRVITTGWKGGPGWNS